MNNNFDRIIPRSGTRSVKYDGRGDYFGKEDVLPLWVAECHEGQTPSILVALH